MAQPMVIADQLITMRTTIIVILAQQLSTMAHCMTTLERVITIRAQLMLRVVQHMTIMAQHIARIA